MSTQFPSELIAQISHRRDRLELIQALAYSAKTIQTILKLENQLRHPHFLAGYITKEKGRRSVYDPSIIHHYLGLLMRLQHPIQ